MKVIVSVAAAILMFTLSNGITRAAIAPIQGFVSIQEIGTAGDMSTDIDAGDVDGDGDIDFVVANDGTRNRLYRNNGNGSFQEEYISADALKTRAIHLVDMDNDSDLDIITAEGSAATSGTVASLLYINDGTGHFSAGIGFESRTAPDYGKSITAADLNQDGKKDVVIAYYGRNRACFQGADVQSWSCNDLSTIGANTTAIAVADIDGDGKEDIVVSNADTSNYILFNNGGSAPTGKTFGLDTEATYALTIGDLNGDGRPEILTGNYNGINHVYQFSSRTSYSFSNLGTFTDKTYGISVGDIDRDGDLDVFVANNGQVNLLMKNKGNGHFQDSDAFSINDTGESYQLVMADVNGDRRNDLACANGAGANTLLRKKGGMNIALQVASAISGRHQVPLTKPSPPSQVAATPQNHTFDITVSWRDNSNNEDNFLIYLSKTDNFSTARQAGTVSANTTRFTARNLTACTTYYFWVVAKNNIGTARSTNRAVATTAPPAPVDLYSTNYIIRSTSLYWSNNSDQCTARYHVYAKNPQDADYQQIPESQDLLDGVVGSTNIGIKPETYIYYRVAAESSSGVIGPLSCSVKAGYRNVVADDSTSCEAAVGNAFGDQPKYPWASTDQADRVTFTWDDVPLQYTSDGSGVAIYANCFRIEYQFDSDPWNLATECYQQPLTQNNWQYQQVDLTNLTPDTSATLRISTHYLYDTNGDGIREDVFSDPIVITGKTLPSGGSGGGVAALGSTPWITATEYYPGKIMVGWTSTSGAGWYEVQRAPYSISTGCSGATYSVLNTFTTTRFDDNVGDWQEYCYRVRACNFSGCTSYSAGEYGSSGGM
ncbi:MAG: FG-GAP-like repeat-containing protein [Desulfobulbaceae bacterium]|nr:FG-GAP-like repeat-containing protein [Desulfobulbaceae bacterium]